MENQVQDFGSIVDSLDFSVILTNATTVIGKVAVVVVGMIALRKAWGFLKSQIRGA